ncbi:MAG: hypothetical protein Q7J65_02520 [Candidatus Marinimicrobia bacterium]|nr:hypothetical protein [Candidatus Neomarinimicrobiota bacterium]
MTRKISESYREEHPRLLAYIRSKVRRLEDAEDIAQPVCVRRLPDRQRCVLSGPDIPGVYSRHFCILVSKKASPGES